MIRGALHDLGDYPGLTEGNGEVVGELFEIEDRGIFTVLDEYEKYDPANRADSLYIRCATRLIDPDVDAWVYFYNDRIPAGRKVESGDWAEHLARTSLV